MNQEEINTRIAVVQDALSSARRPKEIRVLQCFLDNIDKGDKTIAMLSGTKEHIVRWVRNKYSIPVVFQNNAACYEETEDERKYCKEDDELLDKGICKINLHGEDYDRYIDLYHHKRQGLIK